MVTSIRQDNERPAPSSSFTSPIPFSSTARAPVTGYFRPARTAKLSSERRPFAPHALPPSCLKSKSLSHHYQNSATLPPLHEDTIVKVTNPTTPHLLELPAGPFSVQFPLSEIEKPDSKTSYLPRTPYPMSSEDDDRFFCQFANVL
ncbi:hypothetical protein BGZ54_000770 [Gamsiella multidivaricata]|nr:hypothetical protein BGZ54_000770 [Gamsiella multidivaricata]